MTQNEIIDRLAECGVATVYEAAGRKGIVDTPLIQIIPGSRVAGRALTVQCGQDDNLMVHAVMEKIQPGDVLVVAMPEPRPIALIGELLATQALVKKAAAILIDAAVRDVEELRELGLPIWSRYIRVRGATKTQVGSLNHAVSIGGQQINAGDFVVMDTDGVVAVDAARAEEVVATSLARLEKENNLRPKLREGQLSYDLHGLRSVVEGRQS